MSKINHITNSTGTTLNRYTLKHSYDTEEDVLLTFKPSDDYVAGTAFNESAINPMIDGINEKLPTLKVYATTGSTITITCGQYSETGIAVDGYYLFTLPNRGTWTATANNISDIVDVTMDGNYEANCLAHIMGVKRGLSSNLTTWERTDEAVGKSATASVGSTAGSSDFDTMPIFKDIARVTVATNDIMVKIPKFYYRRFRDDNYEYIKIADYPTEGFALHPAFNRADGVRDYIYVGAYETTSNNRSLAGSSPQVNQTRATMRTNAKSKGANWGLIDIATVSAIEMLILVEFANNNVQACIGSGNSSTSAAIATGRADSVANLTGRESGTDTSVAVVWRGIENFWGNVWEWTDGLNFNNGVYYVCTDPTKYADDTASNYTALSFTASTGWSTSYITEEGLDSNNDWCMMPKSAGSGSATSYYADAIWSSTGWRVFKRGGYWDDGTADGLFSSTVSDASSDTYTNRGSRLLYMPLS